MTVSYSAAQVRAAESTLIAAGVPLMQRAATALADEILATLPDRGTVLLLVGSGDNGGDALFAGARLATVGHQVEIVPTAARMHEAGLAAAQQAGARVEALNPLDTHALRLTARHSSVIVDGILGTGSSADAALRGRARDIVEALLPELAMPGAARIVAVDLPSGIHPDTGAVTDPTVLRADTTITFGGVKSGLLRAPGAEFAGEVVLAEIGLGAELNRASGASGEQAETWQKRTS